LLAAVGGLFLLAMCSIAGGTASHDSWAAEIAKDGHADDHYYDSYIARKGGFGEHTVKINICHFTIIFCRDGLLFISLGIYFDDFCCLLYFSVYLWVNEGKADAANTRGVGGALCIKWQRN
jgi:hypothetical protein